MSLKSTDSQKINKNQVKIMSQSEKILLVDDTKDGRLLLKMMLEDDYKISEVDSGKACLAAIDKEVPDLLILDVEMPGMNGHEVCAKLRQQQSTQFLPIIFVSALDSIEERLEGFEVGGDEYLIKPVNEDELLNKIALIMQQQKEIAQVNQRAHDASHMAMEALTVSGELGQIINFVKEVQLIDTVEEVGHAVLRIAEQFCLHSSVMLTTDRQQFVGCMRDSLEASLLKQVAKSSERIFSVGIRTVVKNDHIVLLIKDMPLDDENRYGRLKDHLAVLMDLANGHLMTLEARSIVIKQRRTFLNEVIAVAEDQIVKTSAVLNKHQQQSQQIMQTMLSDLEAILFSLGLDEDQENKLMELADKASLTLADLNLKAQDFGGELGVILEKLYDFLKSES